MDLLPNRNTIFRYGLGLAMLWIITIYLVYASPEAVEQCPYLPVPDRLPPSLMAMFGAWSLVYIMAPNWYPVVMSFTWPMRVVLLFVIGNMSMKGAGKLTYATMYQWPMQAYLPDHVLLILALTLPITYQVVRGRESG